MLPAGDALEQVHRLVVDLDRAVFDLGEGAVHRSLAVGARPADGHPRATRAFPLVGGKLDVARLDLRGLCLAERGPGGALRAAAVTAVARALLILVSRLAGGCGTQALFLAPLRSAELAQGSPRLGGEVPEVAEQGLDLRPVLHVDREGVDPRGSAPPSPLPEEDRNRLCGRRDHRSLSIPRDHGEALEVGLGDDPVVFDLAAPALTETDLGDGEVDRCRDPRRVLHPHAEAG